MELFNVLNEDSKSLEFELPKSDHGFAKLLVNALWKQKGVVAAAYNKSHPLIGIIKILVETDGKAKPRAVVKAALKHVMDENNELKKQVAKL